MVLTRTDSKYLELTVFYSDIAAVTAIGILIIAVGSSLQTLVSGLSAQCCCEIRSLLPTCQITTWSSSESMLVPPAQQLSTAGEKWHQVALSSAYWSTSISAFSLCLHLLVPSFYSTPLTWRDNTWQMEEEEAFTENSQVIKSGEGILQLPDTNKHICICSYGRSIYPTTRTAQPCICALVPSSRYTRILLYHSPLQHL